MNLSLRVHGVYNLPDAWKAKIVIQILVTIIEQDDPQEQLYNYEIKFKGINIKNGKVVPRSLTEEEKAELEAAKSIIFPI